MIDSDQIAIHSAQAQYALDEYRERVLGVKDAIMGHALDWAKSMYPEVRQLSRHAVSDAGDSKLAEEVLKTLADETARVSNDAARESTQATERSIRIEREDRRAKKNEGRP